MFLNKFWKNLESDNLESDNLYENYSRKNTTFLPANFIRQTYPVEPTYISSSKKVGTEVTNDVCTVEDIGNHLGTNCLYDITYKNSEGYSKIVTCDPKKNECSEQVCSKKSTSTNCYQVSSKDAVSGKSDPISTCVYEKECGMFEPTWQIWYDVNGKIILSTDSNPQGQSTGIECNSKDQSCEHIIYTVAGGVATWNKDTAKGPCVYSEQCGTNSSSDSKKNITVKGLCTTAPVVDPTIKEVTSCNIYQCDYSSNKKGSTGTSCSLIKCNDNFEKCGIFPVPETPARTPVDGDSVSCDITDNKNICFNKTQDDVPVIVKTAKCTSNSCKITECDYKNETCVTAVCSKSGDTNTCKNWQNCNYTGECTPARNIFANFSNSTSMPSTPILVGIFFIVAFIVAFIAYFIVEYFLNKRRIDRRKQSLIINQGDTNLKNPSPQTGGFQKPLYGY
jgi:hypothetical protein